MVDCGSKRGKFLVAFGCVQTMRSGIGMWFPFPSNSTTLFLEGVWWEADDGIKYAQNMKDCRHINFQGVYAFCGHAYEGTQTDVERIRDETIGE